MIESSSEFENVMIFKNQLINLDKNQLVELYTDVSNYALFINVIIILINNENILLVLDDEYLDKIYRILDIHRYDLNDKEIFNTINEIIDSLNKIKSIENKEEYVEEYVKYQQNLRECCFKTAEDFLYALSYDAVVIAELKNKDMPIYNDNLFIASIKYFLNIYPVYFEDDEVLNSVYERLGEIASRKGLKNINNKNDAKRLIKVLDSIDLKEE